MVSNRFFIKHISYEHRNQELRALVVELVDTRDLKSLGVRAVPVQVRPGAPSIKSSDRNIRAFLHLLKRLFVLTFAIFIASAIVPFITATVAARSFITFPLSTAISWVGVFAVCR